MKYRVKTAYFLYFLLLLLPVVFVSQTHNWQSDILKEASTLSNQEKYQEALDVLLPSLEPLRDHPDTAYFKTVVAISNTWYGLDAHDSACAFLEKELRFLQAKGLGEHPETAFLYSNLAFQYAVPDLYLPAFNAYQEAIRLFEKNHVLGKRPAYAYKNIAQIYERWRNVSLASSCYELALKVDTGGIYSAEVHSQMANHYHFRGDEEAVMRHFHLGMAEKYLEEEYKAHLNANCASAFVAIGNYQEASNMLLSSLRYYQQNRQYFQENILTNLTALADIATRQNQPALAERYYREAAAEAAAHFKNKNREVAKLFIETGLFYENRGQTQKALSFYQQALIQAFPDFNSPNLADNPAVAEAPLESQAMRAATAKARALLKTASAQAPASLRLNAAHCFDLAFAVAARLRRTYGQDADKLSQSAALRADYQSAALNLWNLWGASKDQVHLERLFALTEQTKAQALADALQQQRALALAGIPDSLLDREASFRLEAAAFSKSLTEKMQEGDSAGIVTAKSMAFRSQKTYDDFLQTLQQQFPKFREYTDADLPTDFALVSKALPDTAALLSWFDAGDRYLWLWLHRGQLSAGEVLRDTALNQQLPGFIGLLADLNRQQADPAAFLNLARTLGEKLLPPDAAQVKSLVIAPDGLLSYLPFEVLLTASPTQNSYAAAPYLLRSCAPVYVWSAKLLTAPPLARSGEGLAHFVPFAATSRGQLPLLPHSSADVPESVSSDQWAGASADAAAFLKQADQFQVLHLSTHAQVGKSGEPGIEFFDRSLRQQEIYAQRLQADLVCLSACETGAGQFAGGEGVLSLARAFAYAGAQSLVASLWQVNDQTTAALFSGFYQNLHNGMSRSEALRKAKLAAIDAPGATKAPFYWAAFTLNGADGAVKLSSRWFGLWAWMLGGVVLSMVLFWGWRGRRKLA